MKYFYSQQIDSKKQIDLRLTNNSGVALTEAPHAAVLKILNFSKCYKPMKLGARHIGLVVN